MGPRVDTHVQKMLSTYIHVAHYSFLCVLLVFLLYYCLCCCFYVGGGGGGDGGLFLEIAREILQRCIH